MAQQNDAGNAARRLFPEDVSWHVLENATNEMLDRHREEAKLRWNFDFKNEVPLEGDWVWEKVEEAQETHTEVVEASKENKNPNT